MPFEETKKSEQRPSLLQEKLEKIQKIRLDFNLFDPESTILGGSGSSEDKNVGLLSTGAQSTMGDYDSLESFSSTSSTGHQHQPMPMPRTKFNQGETSPIQNSRRSSIASSLSSADSSSVYHSATSSVYHSAADSVHSQSSSCSDADSVYSQSSSCSDADSVYSQSSCSGADSVHYQSSSCSDADSVHYQSSSCSDADSVYSTRADLFRGPLNEDVPDRVGIITRVANWATSVRAAMGLAAI